MSKVGKITLSCGHEDHTHPHGWPVIYKSCDRTGQKATAYATYCSSCFGKALLEFPDEFFVDKYEGDQWLDNTPYCP